MHGIGRERGGGGGKTNEVEGAGSGLVIFNGE